MNMKFNRAFTFVEIGIVLSLMSILAGLLNFYIEKHRNEVVARDAEAYALICTRAISMYYFNHHNTFPDDFVDEAEFKTLTSLKDYLPTNFSMLTNYSKINVKIRSEGNYKGLKIEGLTNEKVIQSIIHKFSQNYSPNQIHLNDDNSIQLDLKTNNENFL